MAKVFISYARCDREVAERLCDSLAERGVDPWLDTRNLLPGQHWKHGIREAIKGSEYFLAVLSKRAVSEKGFVQTELRAALEILDTFPVENIFIIPVRIDECRPSQERLRDLHWLDLFPSYDVAVDRIVGVVSTSGRGTDSPDAVDDSNPPAQIPPGHAAPLSVNGASDVYQKEDHEFFIEAHLHNSGTEALLIQNVTFRHVQKHETIRLTPPPTRTCKVEFNVDAGAGQGSWVTLKGSAKDQSDGWRRAVKGSLTTGAKTSELAISFPIYAELHPGHALVRFAFINTDLQLRQRPRASSDEPNSVSDKRQSVVLFRTTSDQEIEVPVSGTLRLDDVIINAKKQQSALRNKQ